MIPLFKPSLDKQEIQAVSGVLKSGWIGSGPKVEEFEQKFAKFIGAKYAVAVSCASSSLQLALQVLNLKPGDQVITPSLTFIATNHAILLNGATPVFCDVDPQTLSVDPADITKRITRRTRAVIAMHYGGHPVDLATIIKICHSKKITLIEDCAHATGSYYKGKHVGVFGDLACFSFAAIKNLTTGDGGMIVTKNKRLAERLKLLRWSGISKDTWNRSGSKKYSWEYDVIEVSGKHQMNDIAATIGIVQLKKLPYTNKQRAAVTRRYNQAFKNINWITIPTLKPWAKSSHHNYVIKVDPRLRNSLIDYLAKKNISTSVHYIPSHHYDLYRQFKTKLPVTDQVWRQIVLLPIFPDLSHSDQNQVIKAITSFNPKPHRVQ